MPEAMQLFVLAQPETFEWPVKVPVPLSGADAGRYGHAVFIGLFPNRSEPELDELTAPGPDGQRLTDRQMAEKVLLGARDLRMPDGTVLNWEAFTPDQKAALLNGPRVAGAVAATFFMAVRGLAAEGN